MQKIHILLLRLAIGINKRWPTVEVDLLAWRYAKGLRMDRHCFRSLSRTRPLLINRPDSMRPRHQARTDVRESSKSMGSPESRHCAVVLRTGPMAAHCGVSQGLSSVRRSIRRKGLLEAFIVSALGRMPAIGQSFV